MYSEKLGLKNAALALRPGALFSRPRQIAYIYLSIYLFIYLVIHLVIYLHFMGRAGQPARRAGKPAKIAATEMS